ncbi:sugar ABC transporter permease [Ruminiclostridium herbifermentans]|uniref:Sugar ABC transporter permease n=1 Tax=Ruminiclostridium herbifermentans TaxID=2488810 RepID=A0A4U7JF11_9FIRM|nr:sugar ABC transporter permease [Ruminiclostridium herbifermentans]QNU67341.1 sugar ABC transporter permease [Ruminiclostridium herbifermentans]
MKLKTRQSIAGFAFALPSLSGFALFFAIPFVISLYYCFTEGVGGARFVGLKNFNDLLHSGSFLLAAKNTLIFNAISVPLIMALSLIFAILLNRQIKGLSFFRSSFILPMVIPAASVILVWNIMFSQYGVLNNLLNTFGITSDVDWIRSDWSMWILVLLYVWKNCGYNVILLLAGLNNIPKEYYEAARIDGARAFDCFTRITIPFLIPTGFFVFMISIVNSFKVFREAYLLAGSYPSLKIYMLQHFMNNNFMNLSYQRLTTAAFLMAILVALLVMVLYKVEGRFGRGI